jgi:hypothetical protein
MRQFLRGHAALLACFALAATLVTGEADALRSARDVYPRQDRATVRSADPQEAVQALWRYARCVVARAPRQAEVYLENIPWNYRAKADIRRSKGVSVSACLRSDTVDRYETMRLSMDQLDGALAEAWLVGRRVAGLQPGRADLHGGADQPDEGPGV